MNHMMINNLFSSQQYRFIKRRPKILQLLNVMDVWTNAIDKGDSIDTIYLDFTKAFDKVSQTMLTSKLNSIGINTNDVSAITSNNDTFHELTFIYFMVCVNGFCRQTMEQSDKDTRCPDEKGIEEISSIKFEEIHVHLTTQIMSIIFYLKYVTYSLFFALWLWKAGSLAYATINRCAVASI